MVDTSSPAGIHTLRLFRLLLLVMTFVARPGLVHGVISISKSELTRERILDAMGTEQPFALTLAPDRGHRGVQTLPDYAPASGLLLCYKAHDSGSPSITELAAAASHGSPSGGRVFILLRDSTEKGLAEKSLISAGANLGQVSFLNIPHDSIWIRDFGPVFVRTRMGNRMLDPLHLDWRPQDEVVTHALSVTGLSLPSTQSGLHFAGGNLQFDSLGNGFTTRAFLEKNLHLSLDYLFDQLTELLGLRRLHVFPTLPNQIDSTGHLDMWMQLVEDNSAVVARFPASSSPAATKVTEDAVEYLESLGLSIHRVPAGIQSRATGRTVHLSYANALRFNNRIFVPSYGHAGLDQEAQEAWRFASGLEVIPIDGSRLIHRGGSLHCIAKQVPEVDEGLPDLQILRPNPGTVLVPNEMTEFEWIGPAAPSSGQVSLRVDLFGNHRRDPWWTEFPLLERHALAGSVGLSLPNLGDGSYVFFLSAFDSTGVEFVSNPVPVRIRSARRRDYNFANSSPKCWEAPTHDLERLFEERVPERDELPSSLIQSRLADSDASGADSLDTQYRSSQPSYGAYSATIFEFMIEEPPQKTLELLIQWEGYGSRAAPIELYVWDHFNQSWGDGKGRVGKDRYLDIRSGLADFVLTGRLQQSLERYFGSRRPLSLLILCNRPDTSVLHDYLDVRLTAYGEELLSTSRMTD